jgi:hypothetical protein
VAIERDEIDARLFSLTLECARPSWRFRLLFGARERQLLGFAINTFMGNRHHNQFMRELEQRYPQGIANCAEQATQSQIKVR